MKFYPFGYILNSVYFKEYSMFGYVNVLKDELKVKDYMIFRSYYCGLCHALGKSCSQSARLGLSFDMTFLALLLSALSKDSIQTKESVCMAHPFSKRKFVISDRAIDYAANASSILYYNKMKDDWHDEHSLKAFLGMIIYRRAYKKASSRYPELSKSINEKLRELDLLEKQRTSEIDLVADCFARITEELFSPDFIGENKRPAAWLGYNIGRWIYVIDAFSDIEKDLKRKSYNPFLSGTKCDNVEKYKAELALRLKESLTFTLENAVSGFNLLKIYKNEEIIKNILFLSLQVKQDSILGIIPTNIN